MKKGNASLLSRGFTIVELLVVIVIIAVLSTITFVAYTGITQKAAAATLQSDLKNASTKLSLYNVTNSTYPADLAAAEAADVLPTNNNTTYQYTLTDGNYCLSVTSAKAGNYTYHLSSLTGTIESGVCDGHSASGTVGPVSVDVYAWGGGGAGGSAGGWGYGSAGGAGASASGVMTIDSNAMYSIVVGGGGVVNSYNGGSIECAVGGGGCASNNNSDNRYVGGGGGYSGIFSSLSVSQQNAILIAGGGGGGGSSRAGTGNAGGAGGGLVGQDGYSPYDDKLLYAGKGGTQTAAGVDASCDSANVTGGQGALLGGRAKINSYGGAGGGGYWGGSGGGYSEANTMAGGGGGSSYFNSSVISNGVLTGGNGTNPGDAGNPLRETAGNSGAVASNGSSGIVIIRYKTSDLSNYIGGTITYDGEYTVHTFTSNGTFKKLSLTANEIAIDAWGGGGGGSSACDSYAGGAGGAASGIVSAASGDYAVVVGGGGASLGSYQGTGAAVSGGGGLAGPLGFAGQGGGFSGVFTESVSQANALLIAGGGGGAGCLGTGGAGGGLSGMDGTGGNFGTGATQIAGGFNTYGGTGLALQGGDSSIGNVGDSGGGGGGGGGYFGGGAGFNGDNPAGNSAGGGGSGYVDSAKVHYSSLSGGSGVIPGDFSNSLRGAAGNGGAAGANSGNAGVVVIRYITGSFSAQGGNITSDGKYTVHTFYSSGTFTIAN